MRLAILDHGHGIRPKAMFVLIRIFSGHPVVDAVKLALYRPSFYRAAGLTQEAMRGPSEWSVADRELMAAYVSKMNETEVCIAAHTATSALADNDADSALAAVGTLAAPSAKEATYQAPWCSLWRTRCFLWAEPSGVSGSFCLGRSHGIAGSFRTGWPS